jgi:RNA polymerase sigma-70 factor (ECF subfamily)
MGMLQASSFNVRPTPGAHQFLVKAGRERPRRIDSCATKKLNPENSVAQPKVASDWAIVQQAIAGGADAQENLFARHTRRLYRAAFAVLRNKEDAEDALQDGLCQAYTNLRSFQGRSSFSSWLTRIVINAALMIRRKSNVHCVASLDEIQENHPEQLPYGAIDRRPDPEKLFAEIEMIALIEDQIRQLPPLMQIAFRLRASNGLSSTESSKALNIRTSAFKSRILRARQKLAAGLQQSLEMGQGVRGFH